MAQASSRAQSSSLWPKGLVGQVPWGGKGRGCSGQNTRMEDPTSKSTLWEGFYFTHACTALAPGICHPSSALTPITFLSHLSAMTDL